MPENAITQCKEKQSTAHSLYQILEIDQLITKLLKLAPDFITLIGTGDTLDWQDYFHVDDSLRSALFKNLKPLIYVRDQQTSADGRSIGIYSQRNSALVFINHDRNIQSSIGGS